MPEPPDVLDVTVEAPADPLEMALNQPLPRTVAVLAVQRYGDSEFKVVGYHDSGGFKWDPNTPPWKRPSFKLATVVRSQQAEEVHEPRELLQLFGEWSSIDAQQIGNWMNLLRERVDDEINLWIIDPTPFEIPWELLFLPPTGPLPGGFLGALLPVARWQAVMRPLRDISEPEECSGDAIAYLSPDLVQGTSALDGIRRAAKLEDLRQALRVARADLALVYVTAYGRHSDHFTKVALSSKDGSEVLTLGDLSAPGELRIFRDSKAVVFLNACHSARPVDDPLLNSPYMRGFTEIFLRRGACGVIGTLGEVGIAFSASTAARLMSAFTADDHGVSIAAALRDLRAEMVARVTDTHVPVEFVWAFMYVYYGHPLTRLRVVRPGEEER